MKEPMKVDLKNRIAVVTGTTGSIGRSIALALAEQGAIIAASDDHNPEQTCDEIRRRGGTAHGYQADTSDSSAVDAMVSKIEQDLGPIDILANCAGVCFGNDRYPVHEFPDSEWERILRVDLDGVFRCSRAVSAQMVQRRKGTIVNITSAFGIVPARLQCAYAVAKAGVMNFTRSHALEVGQYGIRVNGVAPGLILEESLKAEFYASENKQRADSLLSHIPLGVSGGTEDIAAAVLYLVSDDARNVTCQVLVVDGGWTVGFSRDW
jgi:3-oxoacyl-[acyl-carrier protein] reductase